MGQSALFLDRDGVINVDHGYVHSIEKFDFLPAIFDLARFAVHELRWPIVVISNQAGIGRGYYSEETYQALTAWMCRRFEQENAPIARVYHCPYHAEHGVGRYRLDHPWRKPKAGMILQAAADLDLDLAASAVIGDTMNDIAAGEAAGVGLLILMAAEGRETYDPHKVHRVADLPAAIAVLRSKLLSRAE
jgi:D-glycero-D-manno-heptose 1,7-bisphosphate phosphatase